MWFDPLHKAWIAPEGQIKQYESKCKNKSQLEKLENFNDWLNELKF